MTLCLPALVAGSFRVDVLRKKSVLCQDPLQPDCLAKAVRKVTEHAGPKLRRDPKCRDM